MHIWDNENYCLWDFDAYLGQWDISLTISARTIYFAYLITFGGSGMHWAPLKNLSQFFLKNP